MRYFLAIWLLCPSLADAGQLCLNTKTNDIIEYQSRSEVGTCTANALAAGVKSQDIEERTVTEAEWKLLEQYYVIQPNLDSAANRRQQREQKKTRLKTKLGLSESEFNDLKEALLL